MLPGREREGAFLNELLNRVRAGHSAAIMVHGEAGVGKTALLNEAFGSVSDLRVVRAAGVESEMELPFAGLQQLCVSMLGHLEHLPRPQADALRTAFALMEGPPPDRFLIGLAVLSLLSEAAAQWPLACVVDDCQWLDQASAQALAFAARRIQAEGVLLAFAAREPGQDFDGIPGFMVGGLRESDARALLRSVVPWPLDEQVRERILAETRGNPLALLELPRGRSPAELAGGFGLPHELPLAGRIQESFLRRAEELPKATWLMVLLAAAEPGRGGLAAAAAFLDRAAQLSLDPAPQARRALAAAQAKYLAGAPEAAGRLLLTAEAGPLGELERSQVDMIRAQIAYSQNRGSDAPALLLRAARRLEPLDLRMARQTYLDAVLAGHFAGRLAPGSLREAAEAARRVPPVAGPAVAGPVAASDLLLDGLATALTGGYAVGVPTLKQAVRGFRGGGATPEEQLRWL